MPDRSSLHILNTLPPAEAAELALSTPDTRSRLYVARVPHLEPELLQLARPARTFGFDDLPRHNMGVLPRQPRQINVLCSSAVVLLMEAAAALVFWGVRVLTHRGHA